MNAVMNGDKLLALLRENAQEFYIHRHDYTIAGNWVERALEVLRELEWDGDDPYTGESLCVYCEERKRNGHAPDCELAALIGAKVAE